MSRINQSIVITLTLTADSHVDLQTAKDQLLAEFENDSEFVQAICTPLETAILNAEDDYDNDMPEIETATVKFEFGEVRSLPDFESTIAQNDNDAPADEDGDFTFGDEE